MPGITLDYVGLLFKLVFSLIVVVITWSAYRLAQNVLKRRIKDPIHYVGRYTTPCISYHQSQVGSWFHIRVFGGE